MEPVAQRDAQSLGRFARGSRSRRDLMAVVTGYRDLAQSYASEGARLSSATNVADVVETLRRDELRVAIAALRAGLPSCAPPVS